VITERDIANYFFAGNPCMGAQSHRFGKLHGDREGWLKRVFGIEIESKPAVRRGCEARCSALALGRVCQAMQALSRGTAAVSPLHLTTASQSDTVTQ
jgi:hypothetical protein